MKNYFIITRNSSKDAFKLKIDYSLEEVPDTLALNRPVPTPRDFLEKFSYVKAGGQRLEDMLANDMGWEIFSERIASIFARCKNASEIELFPLPRKVLQLNPALNGYRVLGIKREIPCLDVEESDLRWGNLPNGGRHVSAIYECILRESAVPEDVDVFRVAEYPVMTIISSSLAMTIAEYYPTGFVYEVIEAVTHQE